uniref:Putative secreted protein n=1 Tax=Ixodes ricinus TaxID=34613 RepID=A0A6B0UQG1_IXORI
MFLDGNLLGLLFGLLRCCVSLDRSWSFLLLALRTLRRIGDFASLDFPQDFVDLPFEQLLLRHLEALQRCQRGCQRGVTSHRTLQSNGSRLLRCQQQEVAQLHSHAHLRLLLLHHLAQHLDGQICQLRQ